MIGHTGFFFLQGGLLISGKTRHPDGLCQCSLLISGKTRPKRKKQKGGAGNEITAVIQSGQTNRYSNQSGFDVIKKHGGGFVCIFLMK